MKFQLPLTLAIFTLALSACSNGDKSAGTPPQPPGKSTPPPNPPSPPPQPPTQGGPNWQTPQIKQEYTYEFRANQCSTGKHTLSSKNDYCNALLNDSVNSNCAREMRAQNYQFFCTAPTVHCTVDATDFKDHGFWGKLNPFANIQGFLDLNWDGKDRGIYDVFTLAAGTYGKVRLDLSPAAASAANGQIQLFQQRGSEVFLVRSNLGSQFSMLVTSKETEKSIKAICTSDKKFKKPNRDLSRVRCMSRHSGSGFIQEEILTWNTKIQFEKELFRGRHNEKINVRLNPAQQGQDESIEINASDVVGFQRDLNAKASLNEGIEFTYRSKIDSSEVSVICDPASK